MNVPATQPDSRSLASADELERPAPTPLDEMWRAILTSESPFLPKRRRHLRIPSGPRCKLCAAPFGLPGSIVMSRIGHSRWQKNPKYCAMCFGFVGSSHGGAEVEVSFLFADVRGSTPMAERMRPADFGRLMARFYTTATDVLFAHDAILDKFVGDEVIGIFIPSMVGVAHGRSAIEAAQELLRETGHGTREGPWVPVGAAVHTGIAYVGSLPRGTDTELTALGDTVNTTARLASAAGAGEILVSRSAAANAGWSADGLEKRSLELKGKSSSTDVLVLKVEAGA